MRTRFMAMSLLAALLALALLLPGCAPQSAPPETEEATEEDAVLLGFSQLGWEKRLAHRQFAGHTGGR